MFGLFVEHGPFLVDKTLSITERAISWSKKYNMIYIDQPAGAGFSFTKDAKGYATSEDDVARDLYEALMQFYTMFPELLSNNFFVTGESYGGKLEGKYKNFYIQILHRLITQSVRSWGT